MVDVVVDPWNLTAEEVHAWAYDPITLAPDQDWEHCLSGRPYEALYLEFASDESCPKRTYFLGILYLIVGEQARAKPDSTARASFDRFLKQGNSYHHPDLRRWRERSRHLLKHPESFDYGLWCEFGYSSGRENP